MARCFKCDRCGGIYNNNVNHVLTGVANHGGYTLRGLETRSSRPSEKDFDLCDDCANEFMKFINMEDLNDSKRT